MDLIFQLGAGTVRVVGAMSEAEVVRSDAEDTLFGVRFRPGRAALFIEPAARELADQRIPGRLLLGDAGARLTDAVLEARDDAARMQAVADFVEAPEARVRALDARVERAVVLLETSQGTALVSHVAAAVNVGERQLERLFHERVGVGPKVFARVVRMQHALRRAADVPRQTDLAALTGYADEAHLVRDFRRLCGVTLPELLRERRVGFVQSTDAPPHRE